MNQNRDAFSKREKANEDYAIRMREKEKLMELKRKLAEQHEHLKKLEAHMYIFPSLLSPRTSITTLHLLNPS